jgi:hypothetical protein
MQQFVMFIRVVVNCPAHSGRKTATTSEGKDGKTRKEEFEEGCKEVDRKARAEVGSPQEHGTQGRSKAWPQVGSSQEHGTQGRSKAWSQVGSSQEHGSQGRSEAWSQGRGKEGRTQGRS